MFYQQNMFSGEEPLMMQCLSCKNMMPSTCEYFSSNRRKKSGFNDICKNCLHLSRESLTLKTCTKCKKSLPTIMFYQTSYTSTGFSPWCKDCVKEHQGPRNRKMNRRTVLKKHGLTLVDYNKMMLRQGGVCASCGREEVQVKANRLVSLSVDHCHKTGKVRGLLCNNCNVALGHLKDDPERIKALLKYLESHS